MTLEVVWSTAFARDYKRVQKQGASLRLNEETVSAQIRHILAASGRVRLPLPESVTKPYVRHTPVPSTGQPVSAIAIEQRGGTVGSSGRRCPYAASHFDHSQSSWSYFSFC